jgi:hypothetical protein
MEVAPADCDVDVEEGILTAGLRAYVVETIKLWVEGGMTQDEAIRKAFDRCSKAKYWTGDLTLKSFCEKVTVLLCLTKGVESQSQVTGVALTETSTASIAASMILGPAMEAASESEQEAVAKLRLRFLNDVFDNHTQIKRAAEGFGLACNGVKFATRKEDRKPRLIRCATRCRNPDHPATLRHDLNHTHPARPDAATPTTLRPCVTT